VLATLLTPDDGEVRVVGFDPATLGLGVELALAAGALWLTTVRLRTPTRRLARGQRVA
jgi:hypothetical protein